MHTVQTCRCSFVYVYMYLFAVLFNFLRLPSASGSAEPDTLFVSFRGCVCVYAYMYFIVDLVDVLQATISNCRTDHLRAWAMDQRHWVVVAARDRK
jgi:hypothetical protein